MRSGSNVSHATSWVLLIILLLGAWLRLDATLKTRVDAPIRADALDYYSYAYNLRNHKIYSRDHAYIEGQENVDPSPDAVRTPGYSLFLTPFAGERPVVKTVLNITLLQALLGVLVICTTYLVACQLVTNRWALLPSFLVAISPQLINSGVYVLSESLFTFLLMAAMGYGAFLMKTGASKSGFVFVGVLLGLAALTRPTLNYIIPFFMIAFALSARERINWCWIVGLSAGFLLVVSPWLIRNWLVLGGADSTLTINTLVHGHYPNAMYNADPQTLGVPYRFDPQIEKLSASVGDAIIGIGQRVIDAPLEYAHWYLLGKPLMFFSWVDVAAWKGIFTYPTIASPYLYNPLFILSESMMRLTHYVWVLLAIASIFTCYRRRREGGIGLAGWAISLLFIYFVLIHVIGFPIARYAIPLLPIVFILATKSLMELLSYAFVAKNSEG